MPNFLKTFSLLLLFAILCPGAFAQGQGVPAPGGVGVGGQQQGFITIDRGWVANNNHTLEFEGTSSDTAVYVSFGTPSGIPIPPPTGIVRNSGGQWKVEFQTERF